jgi:hypothetical protein
VIGDFRGHRTSAFLGIDLCSEKTQSARLYSTVTKRISSSGTITTVIDHLSSSADRPDFRQMKFLRGREVNILRELNSVPRHGFPLKRVKIGGDDVML